MGVGNIKKYIESLTNSFKDSNGKKNSLILSVIIIILINVVAATLYFRGDLTADNSYSLSEVSEQVVSNVEDPLKIKVFFSKDLPAPYNTVQRYLEDLLVEYKSSSNSNFSYEFVNVEDEEGKKIAAEYGIYQVQVREIQNDQFKSRNAYMGLVIVHGDLIEKIDNLTSLQGIEYKITTTIQKMKGKVNALLGLDSKIKMTLFVSSNLEAFNISGLEKIDSVVKEIHEKINHLNYDQVEYTFSDPSVNNTTSSIADQFGLQKIVWDKSKRKGNVIKAGEGVLGIVLEHGKKFKAVPLQVAPTLFGQYVVDGLEDLEDRVNEAINYLLSDNPPIGYLDGHGEANIDDERQGAGVFKKLLSDMYEVKKVDLTKGNVPVDIKTLVINGPKKQITDEELYKIDQFVMRGGAVVFMVDSFNEIQPQGNQMMMRQPMYLPLNTGLEKLINHYGVTINKDYVLDKNCFVAQQRGMQEMNLYFVPMIAQDSLNSENVITKFLKQLLFIKGSSLTLNEKQLKDNKIDNKVLITSSNEAWLMQGRISLNPMMIRPPADKELSKHNLAVLLEGKFNSFYKDQLPESIVAKNKKSGVKTESTIKTGVKPAKLIVIGTSEITGANLIGEQGYPANAALLHNMLDYLNDNNNIPEMRSKGLAAKPLEKSDDSTRTIIKVLNIAGLPFIVILIGLFVWHRRSTRRKKIQRIFAKGGVHE